MLTRRWVICIVALAVLVSVAVFGFMARSDAGPRTGGIHRNPLDAGSGGGR